MNTALLSDVFGKFKNVIAGTLNHDGKGYNVAYIDGHVSWKKDPALYAFSLTISDQNDDDSPVWTNLFQ